MYKCNFAGRRASGTAGWWLPAVLALGWSVASSPLPAACLQSEDTAIRDLQTMVDKDAARALQLVNTRLRDLEHAQKPDAQLQASLYAVQAQAYSILELGDEAKIAAAAGLKFAARATDPVHLDLLSAYAENVYDPAGIDAAIKSIDGARAAQRPASLADTCLLITRGLLQYRQDRSDLAIASLTQAYRASTAREFAAPRIIAAAVLSTVMGSTGERAVGRYSGHGVCGFAQLHGQNRAPSTRPRGARVQQRLARI
jgi:hypothetical protein